MAARVDDREIPDGAILREKLAIQFLDIERDQERGLLPLLWDLEELRKAIEEYPPPARAAWLSFIDPMMEGISAPMDVLRATRFALQGKFGGATFRAIGPSTKEEAKTDLKALLSYRTLANEIFEVECDTAIEETGGERFLIVKIPVPSRFRNRIARLPTRKRGSTWRWKRCLPNLSGGSFWNMCPKVAQPEDFFRLAQQVASQLGQNGAQQTGDSSRLLLRCLYI